MQESYKRHRTADYLDGKLINNLGNIGAENGVLLGVL